MLICDLFEDFSHSSIREDADKEKLHGLLAVLVDGMNSNDFLDTVTVVFCNVENKGDSNHS